MLKTVFMSSLIITGLGLASCGASSSNNTPSVSETSPAPITKVAPVTLEIKTLPLNKDAIKAARAWFDRQGLDFAAISKLPIKERAARLNQAVYAYCQHGSTPGHINNLFEECKAACGGYSYVLRGALEATGARTRYVNLYNIPNQGNHTVVEVEDDGAWPFYDPTFGAYFTENGEVDGTPLSVEQVSYWDKEAHLNDLVLQSKKEKTDVLNASLTDMYQYPYEHKYMKIENYTLAETLWHEGLDQITILDVGLNLEKGLTKIGDFDALTQPEMRSAYFQQSSNILLDEDLKNDISFRSSYLFSTGQSSITTLTIEGLIVGQNYDFRLLLYNPHTEPTGAQIMAMDRSAIYKGPQVSALPPSRSIFSATFEAQEDTARLAVRNMGPSILAYLYGIEVTPTE